MLALGGGDSLVTMSVVVDLVYLKTFPSLSTRWPRMTLWCVRPLFTSSYIEATKVMHELNLTSNLSCRATFMPHLAALFFRFSLL